MDPFTIFVVLALMAVSYLLAPKPKAQDAVPQEGQLPTASADAALPVLFGTKNIKQGNCVWWGDARTEAIYKKGGKK